MRRSVLTYLLAHILVFLGQLHLQGQNIKKGIDPRHPIGQMILDQWTNENGLLSSNLTSVYEARSGFLWITSHNGLQRFEGHQFRSYTSLNVPFLNSNSFYRTFEGPGDTLWFSTERSGLLCVKDNLTFPFTGNEAIPKAIIALNFSQNGELWIGSKNKGLFIRRADGGIEKVNRVPEVTINNIKEDLTGRIWIATDGKGLYCLNGNEVRQFTTSDGLESDVINHIEIDSSDRVFIATIEGVNMIVGDKITTVEVFGGLDINQLLIDDYETIWAACEQGLVRWNESSEIFELFGEKEGLPGRQVSGVTFDKEGSLWVSTKKAGLVRFRLGRITNISVKSGLSSNKINIVTKHDGKFFIGADNGDINISEGQGFRKLIYDSQFQDAGIRDFLFDSEGRKWVVNYNGVLLIDGETRTILGVESGLPSSEVRRIYEDSSDRIWIGTRTGGIVKLNAGGQIMRYDKSNGLDSNYILSVDEDFDGRIVVGTNAGGLSVIDELSQVKTYHIKEDDSGILIFNVHIDEENTYLLCTNIGLFKFREGRIDEIIIGQEPESKTFFDLIDDGIGGYWLTSNTGIYRIGKQDVRRFLSDEIPWVEYDLYDDKEGMLNNECTGATRSFFDSETGKIYVPTFEGIAIVDPSIDLKNLRVPEVYITGLQIDDEEVSIEPDELKVNPGAFRYTFDFASLSYISPSKVRYKYRLEGIDKDWIGPVSTPSVEYTNLPYGEYKFHVKGTNNDGIWNDRGDSLAFRVLPYYNETFWFYMVIGVILFVLLWIVYKWRIKEITERNLALGKINSELDRFVYSASHDLRAPLASTMGLVNIAKMEPSATLKDEYLELIEECVNKMDNFISDIIDFSRNKNKEVEPVNFDIRALIEEIFDDLKYLENYEKIEVEIATGGADMVYADKLRIKMILSNLIANAIVYSRLDKEIPYIKVRVIQNAKVIKLIVEDNGKGIPDAQKEKVFDMFYRADQKSKGTGLGLYIVKESVHKLGGTVQMQSEEGKGSTFSVEVPRF